MTKWADYLVKPCGTEAACRRHRRRGEQACRACLVANSVAVQERRWERKRRAAV